MEISTLYWLITLTKISTLGSFITVVSAITGVPMLVALTLLYNDTYDDEAKATVMRNGKKIMIWVFIALATGITLEVFVPNREEMLIILGVHEVTTSEQVTDTTNQLFEYIQTELQERIDENVQD